MKLGSQGLHTQTSIRQKMIRRQKTGICIISSEQEAIGTNAWYLDHGGIADKVTCLTTQASGHD